MFSFLSLLFNDAVSYRDYTSSVVDEEMIMEHRLNETGQGKTEVVGAKTAPSSHYPLQILLDLGWDVTWTCAVRALPVNTRTMVRLCFPSLKF
jgi:hypothetical protein